MISYEGLENALKDKEILLLQRPLRMEKRKRLAYGYLSGRKGYIYKVVRSAGNTA